MTIELSKVKAELNEWRYLIGDDVVDAIILNLEEEADEDEPQTCDTCKYGEDKHKYAHICNECGVGINNYEPRTERNE